MLQLDFSGTKSQLSGINTLSGILKYTHSLVTLRQFAQPNALTPYFSCHFEGRETCQRAIVMITLVCHSM